nr:unnamed protein product [Callosobruchus chinensis]
MKLVAVYKEYECIWNINSPNYRNRAMRVAAYEEIVKYMAKENFGISELKQKIKNLRCTYNQEVRKTKKSKKSGAGVNDAYITNIIQILFCLLLSSSITSSTPFIKISVAFTKNV